MANMVSMPLVKWKAMSCDAKAAENRMRNRAARRAVGSRPAAFSSRRVRRARNARPQTVPARSSGRTGSPGSSILRGIITERNAGEVSPQAGSPPGFGANRPSESTVSAYLVNMNESSMSEDAVNLVQIDRTRIAAKAAERSGAAAWNERRIPVSAMTDPFGTAACDN